MARLDQARVRLHRLAAKVESSPASRPAIAALSHDRRTGGQLLAGALAFRLFAVLLPLALVVAVIVGATGSAATDAGDAVGIREATMRSVADSSKLEGQTLWVVLGCGLVALLYAAVKAGRAVHAVYSLAWNGAVERLARPIGAGFAVLGTIAAVALVWALTAAVQDRLETFGLLVALLAVVPFFGIWLGVSMLLPHEGRWTALIPGAVLVAVGLQVVHLGTVLVVANQIERASETYGPLGAALTILVWLYVISRLIVGAAMLDVTMARRRDPAAAADSPAGQPWARTT